MGGFVAYELWVTDVIARSAQGRLADSLATRSDAVVAEPRSYDPAGFPESPIALPAGLRLADPPPVLESQGEPPADPTPAATIDVLPGESPLDPAAGPSTVLTEPVPPDGDAVGRIVIPAASVDWTVVEGVGSEDLRMGAGHMPGTALPGEPGNAVISGHRTTYGAPFADLDRLRPGDEITVETATGTHVYLVAETRVVAPGDVWVAEQWRGAWLTLTTCHPRYSSAQRLVVFAHLVDGPNAGVILASS